MNPMPATLLTPCELKALQGCRAITPALVDDIHEPACELLIEVIHVAKGTAVEEGPDKLPERPLHAWLAIRIAT